jgi:hypothetical protein
LIVTDVVIVAIQFAEEVTVNVYIPALSPETFVILGLCNAEEKLLGPLQEYVPPPPPVKVKFPVLQRGELLLAVGIGNGFIVTEVVAVFTQLAAEVTVNV